MKGISNEYGEMVEEAMANDHKLNAWEREFLEDIEDDAHANDLSSAQEDKLEDIHDKATK